MKPMASRMQKRNLFKSEPKYHAQCGGRVDSMVQGLGTTGYMSSVTSWIALKSCTSQNFPFGFLTGMMGVLQGDWQAWVNLVLINSLWQVELLKVPPGSRRISLIWVGISCFSWTVTGKLILALPLPGLPILSGLFPGLVPQLGCLPQRCEGQGQ